MKSQSKEDYIIKKAKASLKDYWENQFKSVHSI